MSGSMVIRKLEERDFGLWLRMRHALWPEASNSELEEDMKPYASQEMIQGLPSVVLIAEMQGKGVGFAEVSLRPLAAGCVSSPVGYLEGWYVTAELRGRGIGAALVRAGEQWARSKGCEEFASDCWVKNDVSRAAHGRLGFEENEQAFTFHKHLVERPRAAVDFVGVVPFEISTAVAVELVTDAAAGGIAVFLGTTRGEKNGEGKDLVALEYQAYEEMAISQMRQFAVSAHERWPIRRLALIHRVGRVEVGKPSVLIAVSTPHRGEAFEACRFLIDTLKAQAAIWKKEVWADGSGEWVHSGGEQNK